MNISWASLGSCPLRFRYFELHPLSTINPVFYFLDSSQSPIMSCSLYQHNKIILLKRWAQSLAQVSMLVFPLFFWEHVPNCIYFIDMNCYLCLILQIHGFVILQVQVLLTCISWAWIPSPLIGFSLVTRQINHNVVILCFLLVMWTLT